MANFTVDVSVVEPADEPGVWHININPESVPLDGRVESTITWNIKTTDTATFLTREDVRFQTTNGRNRFTTTLDSASQITATINGAEEDQTIYTYLITVHLKKFDNQVAVRVDPEVDNPPPPPT
ncbi:MAG TPA: hypothetical protein VFV49_13790 [Thermoanaerobaculia bacterium]|nr:hypothetical protein [Thermoanaerobaculia bacterium]